MTALNTWVLYSQNWHQRGIDSVLFFSVFPRFFDLDQSHFLKMRWCNKSLAIIWSVLCLCAHICLTMLRICCPEWERTGNISEAPELELQWGMILIHPGIGILLILENTFQIIGRHLHVKSPCFCHAPHPCKERISYQLFKSYILVWGFFDTEGHICC